jgi:glycosyltransferase involved in cell wall biosynthesis
MSPRTSFPSVSVVVPALNESTPLRGTVTQLQATLPARSEILVVDDGFTDSCADFLTTAAAGMTLLRTAYLGAARACN